MNMRTAGDIARTWKWAMFVYLKILELLVHPSGQTGVKAVPVFK